MFFPRFFSQMTSPAVHYDVNSQYLKTYEVDSPARFICERSSVTKWIPDYLKTRDRGRMCQAGPRWRPNREIAWAQLFEGRLALNPGLNLTRVSFSCVQKHFLG